MRWVREVVLLERIEREVIEFVLVRGRLGHGDDLLPAKEPLVPFARHGPELLVVVVARQLDEMLLAVNVDLRDDGLDVVRLDDVLVRPHLARPALEWAARLRASLADLVVGDEEDGVGLWAPQCRE